MTRVRSRFTRDFWLYFSGQSVSRIGSSFTEFALPLLVFKLTGSAISLAVTTATTYLPYLLFGLFIGAITDRVDRKRLMVAVDLLRALAIALLPLVALAGTLRVQWIYLVAFVQSTMQIFFEGGQVAAVAMLVRRDQLVSANGRLQASYSAGRVLGPTIAGALVAFVPVERLLFLDAASFLLSAISLALIRRRFNQPVASLAGGGAAARRSLVGTLLAETAEGLRYLWRQPLLRAIAVAVAVMNLAFATVPAQLVLFAKQRLGASDSRVGFLYAAGAVGVISLSLAAGALRRRLLFSQVTVGALILAGLLIAVLGQVRWYLAGLGLWAGIAGLAALFTINTTSLRQQIVPNRLLGRVSTATGVLAWSAIPVGVFAGAGAIHAIGQAGDVYSLIGLLLTAAAVVAIRSPLGRADRYLDGALPGATPDAEHAPRP